MNTRICDLTCLVLTALLVTVWGAVPAHSQESSANPPPAGDYKPPQVGAINIEEQEEKKETYGTVQDKAISFFSEVESKQTQLAQGNISAVGSIPDNILNYLSGVYLYCAVNLGTCPLVLETLLETDIINGKVNHDNDCPNLKRFWNFWVGNGMEERHKYLTKIAHVRAISDFNTKERPKFLLCQETVKQQTTSALPSDAYFKQRYSQNPALKALSARLAAYLNQLKQGEINVFLATGSKSPETAKPSSTTDKKMGTGSSTTKKHTRK